MPSDVRAVTQPSRARSSVPHPDNLLNTGRLPSNVEKKLRNDGIRFATKLQTSNGHTFLLCGQRCPCEAGADMLRDALRVRRNS